MLTLGVDLATVPRRTAVCVIEWPETPGRPATIELIRADVTDDDILSLATDADVVGIDAPFGWPRAWAESVGRHKPGESFMATGPPASITRRATDTWVAENVGIYPLSVAANLIGATAIRCARLLHRLEMPIDTGIFRDPPVVVEVYPAAALRRWGLSHRRYKGRQLASARKVLIDALVTTGLPVQMSDEARVVVESSDDALDALLCSLIARAVSLGLTDDVPDSLRRSSLAEGWIRVPSVRVPLTALVIPDGDRSFE